MKKGCDDFDTLLLSDSTKFSKIGQKRAKIPESLSKTKCTILNFTKICFISDNSLEKNEIEKKSF